MVIKLPRRLITRLPLSRIAAAISPHDRPVEQSSREQCHKGDIDHEPQPSTSVAVHYRLLYGPWITHGVRCWFGFPDGGSAAIFQDEQAGVVVGGVDQARGIDEHIG